MKIYALHGFLGLPSDFNTLPVTAVSIKPAATFDAWAHDFNATIDPKEENVLLGYSMGGRLALQAYRHNPRLWTRLILISTHPGLENSHERTLRIENDEKWARRFESEPWDTLMRDWNGQEVLKGISIPRHEHDYDRKDLAAFLRNFSLGRQEVFEPPATWVVGENDTKFRKRLHHLDPIVAPRAGHRVIFENREFVGKLLE